MKHFIISLSVFLLLSCSGESEPVSVQIDEAIQLDQSSESDRLNQWFAEKNEERLAFSPIELAALGRKEFYDQLDQFNDEAVEEQLNWHAGTIEEMENNFSYEALDFESKTSWDVWKYLYQRSLDIHAFSDHNYIFEQMDGMHSFFPVFMANYHRVDTIKDMEDYIARLGEIGRALNQELDNAKANAELGVRAPRFAYQMVIEESRKLIAGVPFNAVENDSPLWSDSQAKINALFEAGEIDEREAELLRGEVESALLVSVQPAYADLIAWLSQDLENTDAQPQGVWALPNGVNYYQQLLSYYTTTDLTAEEIHQIGLDEVERIRGEMEDIKDEVDFDGDMLEFFKFVSSDEQFFYSNTAEGRQDYLDATNVYYDFIKTLLPQYFGILPKADLVVKRVEAFREQDGAPALYFASSPDGSIPGVYYVHMSDMGANPTTQLESVAYHEGLPGHHMQIAISLELTSVPEFRRQTSYNAYVEGWGLYAEKLAWEMGAYEDPYKNIGRLSNEMWRAVRLVVDTGMHAMGWTEEEAINYFAAHTITPIESIVAEIRRYLVIPGQATSYKIGMLKILELRERAREALGDDFDIRDFHDVVLGGGALPLDILERRVNNYIEQNLQI